jgi:hypothetical protein
MVEMVDARRSAEIKEDRRDLFSGLLEAADNDRDISEAITEPELLCKCQSSYLIPLMNKALA